MFYDAYLAIIQFIELGGDVLYLIAALTFLMWTLIFERVWYFRAEHKNVVREATEVWEGRPERRSWSAHAIREGLISNAADRITGNLSLIQTCVMLCPLLGLLGTVTGMVEVFEVMAISGSSNPRSMAAGVSKATIPTMAGMVAALSGIAMSTYLQRKVGRERELIQDHLVISSE